MKLWSKIERKRRKYIRIYSKRLKNAMGGLIKPVLEMLEYSTDLDGLKANIPALIKTDKLNELLIEMYGSVGRDFGSNVKDFIKGSKKSIIKNIEEDIWQEQMEQYALFNAGVQIRSINTYTKKEFLKVIQSQIDKGIKEGLGSYQIAANIKKKLPGEWRRGSTWKARRIAVTEVNTASNKATYLAADQTGYNMNKFWIVAPPGVAKEERHVAIAGLNGQKRAMNEAFDVGGVQMMHPGDASLGAEADNIVNCHCSVGYEVI